VARVLFVSGAVGLGHATRDLAIARELRRLVPDLELVWLAGGAAREAIEASGEALLPEAHRFETGASVLESAAGEFALNLADPSYLLKPGRPARELVRWIGGIKRNLAVFREVTARARFDLVVGDETFELAFALHRDPALKRAPFVLITDWIGVDAMTRNPLERGAVRLLNGLWVRLLTRPHPACDRILFVGEPEDLPDRTFGWRLPNRRECSRRLVTIVGYVCPFVPSELPGIPALRASLGYRQGPLITCSIGGTPIGVRLLHLCARAYPSLLRHLPALSMVLVAGPGAAAAPEQLPDGVTLRGYVPDLYKHLAASDLAIVQGGGTTTLELTALRKPFLYFPLEGHFEQQLLVAERLRRHGAGRRLSFAETTPARLAEAALAAMREEATYPPLSVDGAERAAESLKAFLTPGPG
jgi:UDP:flavonoid glycosyltransferase YjiC (YdhE family)